MNADSTGMRKVRKGALVVLDDLVGRVVKVNRGNCMVQWPGVRYARCHACRDVALLAPSAFTKSTCGFVQIRLI